MGIFMFTMSFICNMFTVLICWFAYGSRDRYAQGMLMGVHIPAEEVENENVQEICRKSRLYWKRLQIVGLITGILVCFLSFYRMEIFLLVWMVWLIAYIGGLYYLIYAPHRQMYRLKMEHGWICEETKHLVHIDTETSARSGQMAIDWKWQIPVVLVSSMLGLRVFENDALWGAKTVAWIFYFTLLLAVLAFLILHMWVARKQNVVYSEDPQVNFEVNRVVKRSWSEGLLLGGWLTGLSLWYLLFQFGPYRMPDTVDYVIYGVLQVIALAAFLIPILSLERKKQELLAADTRPVYVDDDEYWKNGWYSNPNDRRLLVQDRLSSSNFSFNMARPAAKVISGAVTALTGGVLIWFFVLMISMMNMSVEFVSDGTHVYVESVGYKCEFDRAKIQEVELLSEFPDERYSKINGIATEQMNVGHFSSKESGKTMMFLYAGEYPIIRMVLEDMTVLINSDSEEKTESWFQSLKAEGEKE